VEVRWSDATIDLSAEGDPAVAGSAADFGGQSIHRDLGYLIRKDKKDLVLAVSLCEDDHSYRHANTIPRGWVKQIIILTRPPEAP
jgi:hypothetical protein